MSNAITERPTVLIVDDSKVIRLSAKKMLSEQYQMLFAEDGDIAWEIIQQTPTIALVFTDLNMPNMDGLTLLGHIRGSANKDMANLPVIILSGAEDEPAVKERAMQAGANDFVFKPFDSVELNSRVKSYVNFSKKVANLEEKTVYDVLTGLFKLTAFQTQAEKAVSFAHRHQMSAGVCILEINFLQEYESKYGKKVAEIILVTAVNKLKKLLREEDIAARLGASKITLFLPGSDETEVRIVLQRLQSSLQKLVFDVGEKKLQLAINIGFSVLRPGEMATFAVLLNQAQAVLTNLEVGNRGQLAGYMVAQEVEVSTPVSLETRTEAVTTVRTAAGLEQALQYIVSGEFDKISEKDRQCVTDQLRLFMRFVDAHPPASLQQ